MRATTTSPRRRLPIALAIALVALVAPGPALADATENIRVEIQSALPAGLSVVEVRVPRALSGAASAGPIGQVQVDWRRPARAGWLTLRVQIGDRSGWVRARLAAVLPVVVAIRDLPAGHTVGEADVRVELRAAAAGARSTIAGLEGAVGRALRQPVAAGAPLLSAALERSAPLPRGTPVTALIRRGRLTISAAGVLERSAPIGQATTVRLRATGRVVRGRLVDSQTVLIEVTP